MMNNQYKKLKAGNRGDSGYFLNPLAKSFYENGVFSTSFNEYQKINLSPVLRRLNGELFTSISLHPKSLYDSGDTIKDENVSKIAMLFIDLDFIDDEKKIQFKRLLKEKKYDDLKEIYTPILKNLTSAYMQVMGKKPSYINISGGGFHLIDLLPSSHCWTKEGIDYLKMNQSSLDISGLKIIDKNQWKSIYNEIISQIKKTFTDNTLYLDEKCSNLSRLLRDIGFYHEKDKANPHEIETIKDDDFIEHGEIKSQIIDGLLSEALKKEALNTQEKDHRGDKDHGGEEGYHFKMNQRVKIYKKNDNKGMLYKIDDLYQALKYDELESFIEKNGDYYNIQASLYEEDFPPNAEKDRPADKGSLLISIENMGRGVNRYTKATLKLQLRNKEGRFKEALDGASFGVYPSIYTYTKTDPRSFGMIATNVIINKNEKEIYLYNENAYHIDSSGERKDYEKSSLYDDLTKVLWSDEKGKPIDISTISQATAQIVYNQLKAKAKKIDRFSLLPVLNDDFQIEHCAGYHANTKSYILPPKAHDFKDFKIDESLFNDPKKMGDIIKEEADYIDSLFSFPLKKKEYSLQIIGALLEIFIQDRLANKPFLVIQANEQGRGKTLLAKALSAAIGSIDPTLTPFEQNKATLKDEITSQVNSDKLIISYIIDNVDGHTGGAFINTIATSNTLNARVKYASKSKEMPINFVFIFTGNNMKYGDDLGRRIHQITLESFNDDRRIPKFKGRAKGNEEAKELKDSAYLAFLKRESPEIIKALTKILAYSNQIKKIDHIKTQLESFKPKLSFNEWDEQVRKTCAVIGILRGSSLFDIEEMSNGEALSGKTDLQDNDLFIRGIMGLLGDRAKKFHPSMLMDEINRGGDIFNDNEDLRRSSLEALKEIGIDKNTSPKERNRLFNRFKGKTSIDKKYKFVQLDIHTQGKVWWAIQEIEQSRDDEFKPDLKLTNEQIVKRDIEPINMEIKKIIATKIIENPALEKIKDIHKCQIGIKDDSLKAFIPNMDTSKDDEILNEEGGWNVKENDRGKLDIPLPFHLNYYNINDDFFSNAYLIDPDIHKCITSHLDNYLIDPLHPIHFYIRNRKP